MEANGEFLRALQNSRQSHSGSPTRVPISSGNVVDLGLDLAGKGLGSGLRAGFEFHSDTTARDGHRRPVSRFIFKLRDRTLDVAGLRDLESVCAEIDRNRGWIGEFIAGNGVELIAINIGELYETGLVSAEFEFLALTCIKHIMSCFQDLAGRISYDVATLLVSCLVSRDIVNRNLVTGVFTLSIAHSKQCAKDIVHAIQKTVGLQTWLDSARDTISHTKVYETAGLLDRAHPVYLVNEYALLTTFFISSLVMETRGLRYNLEKYGLISFFESAAKLNNDGINDLIRNYFETDRAPSDQSMVSESSVSFENPHLEKYAGQILRSLTHLSEIKKPKDAEKCFKLISLLVDHVSELRSVGDDNIAFSIQMLFDRLSSDDMAIRATTESRHALKLLREYKKEIGELQKEIHNLTHLRKPLVRVNDRQSSVIRISSGRPIDTKDKENIHESAAKSVKEVHIKRAASNSNGYFEPYDNYQLTNDAGLASTTPPAALAAPPPPPLPPTLAGVASSVPPPPLPPFLQKGHPTPPKTAGSVPPPPPPPAFLKPAGGAAPPAPPPPPFLKPSVPAAPPVPPPVPKLVSDTSQIVVQKKNAATEPHVEPTRPYVPRRPSSKLKQIHWDKLEDTSNTIWRSADDRQLSDKLNELGILEELENQFYAVEAKKFKTKPVEKRQTKLSFLSRDLQQQFGINLYQFASLSEDELVTKVLRCDKSIVQNSSLVDFFCNESLTDVSPNLMRSFAPYSRDFTKDHEPTKDPAELDRLDRVYLELCYNLRRYWTPRSKCVAMCLNYEHDLEDLRQDIQLVKTAVDAVSNSKALVQVLYIIKNLGNFMNDVSKTADGFKLSTLQRLKFLKDAKNTTTLLNYIERIVRTRFSEYASFVDEIKSVHQAHNISISNLETEFRDMKNGIDVCMKALTTGALSDSKLLHPKDRIVAYAKPILEKASDKVSELETLLQTTMADYNRLMEHYGEKPGDEGARNSFLAKFKTFVDDYKKAQVDSLRVEQEEKAYQKRKQMMEEFRKSKSEKDKPAENIVENLLDQLRTKRPASKPRELPEHEETKDISNKALELLNSLPKLGNAPELTATCPATPESQSKVSRTGQGSPDKLSMIPYLITETMSPSKLKDN
ncbi:hypothetical protein OGAPHI_006811 [Ogataea philodendri]|uniref:FH2 domain-containing protein n=1 Tax=Ogataea philodendri TaxID=1378263 RepID=A0A9P8NXS8_9ASCO|nr:uncharacterized protein OGAPHI_006811 [Ogataea philodendri]KAH3661404.1 hypothetical protein OGAPHI_006811 [Ogataea philodendri]